MSKYRHDVKLLKSLLATLPYSARPMIINGVKRKPKFSNRVLAELKKGAELNNLEWPMPEKKKEIKRHGFIKNLRETKTTIANFKRISTINEKLKGNQQRLEKLREENRKKRYKDPFDFNNLLGL
eukprot:gene10583-3102_t